MLRSLIVPGCALLAACSQQASHIPNPVLLPGHAVSTAVSNATYGARRGRVKAQVETHHTVIMTEILSGGGPELSRAMDLARVPAGTRPALIQRLQADRALYKADAEALTVALMVHGA